MTILAPDPAPSSAWWHSLRLHDVALATIVVLAVGFGFALLLSALNALIGIFLALLIATSLRPLMNRLRGAGLSPTRSAALSVLFVVLIALGFLLLVVPLLGSQAEALSQSLPEHYTNLRQSLSESQYMLVRQAAARLPTQLAFASALDSVALVTQVSGWLPLIGHALIALVTSLLFTYYWLLYRDRSIRSVLLLLPQRHRDTVEQTWLRVEEQIGAFIRAQLLLGLAIGLLSLLGYWSIGISYPLLLALLAGLLEFIPYLGPFLATLLATMSGLSISPSMGVSALVVGLIVQQIEGLLLAPRIMQRTVGISPVVTLLAFIGFAALFGPLGGLLAIPLAAVLQALFRSWVEQRTSTVPAADAGRGVLDRLRYQVAELSDDVALTLRHKDGEADPYPDDAEEELWSVLADLHALIDREENRT